MERLGGFKQDTKIRDGKSHQTSKTPSGIVFVRNRMLYARAALSAHGHICFGLRHIHVLNRFPLNCRDSQTTANPCDQPTGDRNTSTDHVMMYIFPRQFGLHNVFTSAVDSRRTVQPLQDYTLREDEISRLCGRAPLKSQAAILKLPKRLRGGAYGLVRKLQIAHERCAYKELLDYYCPILVSIFIDFPPKY